MLVRAPMSWRTLLDTVAPRTAALLVIFLVLWTWAARIAYPYDLEWMEGGMLAHAWQLQHHLPIYAAPTPQFTPYVYPPGYSAVVALLGEVFGLSMPLGRAVSILGTLAAAGGVGFFVHRLGGSPQVSLGSAAVLLGTYPNSGAFYDLVRPDGLFIGLLSWSLACMLVRARWAPIVSGLLLVAAFLVKHNAAAFGLPILLGFWWRGGLRPAAWFAASSIAPALAAVGLLQWQTDGWFLRYLLELPRSHPLLWGTIYVDSPREWGTAEPVALAAICAGGLWYTIERRGPLPRALVAFAPVLAGMLAGALGTYVRPPPESGTLGVPSAVAFFALGAAPVAAGLFLTACALEGRRPSAALGWWALFGFLAVGMCAWMRAHAGGFLNVHLPMFWAVALAFGAVCTWAAQRWPSAGMRTAVGVVMTLQLVWALARFDRARLVPTPADRAAGDRIVERLRGIDGEVLSPFAAWLPVYAGKSPSLHAQGLWDLELSPEMRSLTQPVRAAVRRTEWGAVLAGNQRFPYGILDTYEVADQLVDAKAPFLMPRTGYRARPERLLLPKGSTPTGPGPGAP